MVDRETMQLVIRRLGKAAGKGSKVILFGSYARDEGGRDSDLDFLVIEPEVADPAAESVRLRRELRGILCPDGHHRRLRQPGCGVGGVQGTVIHEALAEGRVVHG